MWGKEWREEAINVEMLSINITLHPVTLKWTKLQLCQIFLKHSVSFVLVSYFSYSVCFFSLLFFNKFFFLILKCVSLVKLYTQNFLFKTEIWIRILSIWRIIFFDNIMGWAKLIIRISGVLRTSGSERNMSFAPGYLALMQRGRARMQTMVPMDCNLCSL